jgi:hypothetical protein
VEALILWADGAVPASKKYPDELRDRALRLVFQIPDEA